MRILLILALIGLIAAITAQPVDDDREQPNSLLDIADAGGSHSNEADRLPRHWGWGGGWGGPRWGWGGGWGGHRWGWGGGWGGPGWGGGWGGPRWGWGGGWGVGFIG